VLGEGREGGTVWVVEDVGGTDSGDVGSEVCYSTVGNDEKVKERIAIVIHS
jgi:hypothetical protein